jgi:predicted mannosyl-3-phosphoglycerate phosphatase (HAD superfamily)
VELCAQGAWGVTISRSFTSLSLEEINELTGLPKDQAFRAWQREYDKPFVIESGDVAD